MSVTIQDARNVKTKIKVSPQTTMKEVLADFVSQSGLDDVNRWSLYHKNKLVDLSLPWRLTGFPNNVTFTVAQRASSAVPVVSLALQLEDGARLQSKFLVSATLWQVLLAFEASDAKLNFTKRMGTAPLPEKSGLQAVFSFGKTEDKGPLGWMQPVMVLLNKRFATVAELCATTLQSLGLTSGTVLVRLQHEWTDAAQPPTVEAAASVPAEPVVFVAPVAPVRVDAAPAPVGDINNSNNVAASSDDPRRAKREKAAESEDTAAAVAVPENRNVVVFAPSDVPFNPADYEVPDDFYDLSSADFAALKSAAGKGADEPLMTREFREKRALQVFSKFSKTNLRVRFPDRWELQGTFVATENAAQVVAFVQRHIVTPERPFELYTTPPRQALADTSLVKQHLVPAAVVYFAWRGERSADEQYLTADAKQSATTLRASEHHLSTFSNKKPVELGLPSATAADAAGGSTASGGGGGGGGGAAAKGKEEATGGGGAGKKVPAWLKLGKK